MERFDWIMFDTKAPNAYVMALVAPDKAQQVRRFHSGIEGYEPTPLVSLNAQAERLGLGALYVKNESKRFGLNAFKSLGGSYAVAKYLCGKLGIPVDENAYTVLRSAEAKEKLGDITFITATDGNHGRGVAWAARIFGQKAVVFMPKGSAAERLENIRAQGAHAEITNVNYDDTVRFACKTAEENGWVLVQDTAWPGYEEIPESIIQGYTTMAVEIEEQLNGIKPTHLFLQAGVGSFPGSFAACAAGIWGDERPVTVVMEPAQADCHYRTAKADDGTFHIVTGSMNSMMAGLCCGEPCPISWKMLESCADAFVSCGDYYSARGMRLLGKPLEGDETVVSGESGAVGAGVIEAIMIREELKEFKEKLGLNSQSRVLLISTEGDTDKENYRRILAD